MAKAGELDWTGFDNGERGEPEHLLSKPITKDGHKGGDKVTADDLRKDADNIIAGFEGSSPTQEEFNSAAKILLGLPEKEESEEDWSNKMSDTIDKLSNTKVQNEPDIVEEFAKGKSFNGSLSEQELLHRNMYVD